MSTGGLRAGRPGSGCLRLGQHLTGEGKEPLQAVRHRAGQQVIGEQVALRRHQDGRRAASGRGGQDGRDPGGDDLGRVMERRVGNQSGKRHAG